MKALYIDDETSSRIVMGDMLAVIGMSPVHASSLEEALALWSEGDFALVLADLRVTGVHGVRALDDQRSATLRAGDPPARIVVVTPDLSLLTRARCLEAGADAMLMKPVALDALIAIAHRGGR